MTHLSIIIPVYNGAACIRGTVEAVRAWLRALPAPSEILVIDDGSRDATPEVLRELARTAGPGPALRWLRNEPNQGKGFAVRRGMLEARGAYRIFLDADLTYPVECIGAVLAALEGGADVAIADRLHAASRYVVAPSFFRYLYTRHVMGRMFNLLARAFVVPGIRDTQAGLKGFRAAAALELFPRLSLSRFSFDVELLYLAQRRRLVIEPVGITFLYNSEPSTVRFVRDSVGMLIDMARIRLRGLRGVYERPTSPEAMLAHPACAPEARG